MFLSVFRSAQPRFQTPCEIWTYDLDCGRYCGRAGRSGRWDSASIASPKYSGPLSNFISMFSSGPSWPRTAIITNPCNGADQMARSFGSPFGGWKRKYNVPFSFQSTTLIGALSAARVAALSCGLLISAGGKPTQDLCWRQRAPTRENSIGSIAIRPCRKSKDGAPSADGATNSKGRATRPRGIYSGVKA